MTQEHVTQTPEPKFERTIVDAAANMSETSRTEDDGTVVITGSRAAEEFSYKRGLNGEEALRFIGPSGNLRNRMARVDWMPAGPLDEIRVDLKPAELGAKAALGTVIVTGYRGEEQVTHYEASDLLAPAINEILKEPNVAIGEKRRKLDGVLGVIGRLGVITRPRGPGDMSSTYKP